MTPPAGAMPAHVWHLALHLADAGGAVHERAAAIARALIDAQHEGAASALDQLARELDDSGVERATVELLRALANGYRRHVGTVAP